MKVLVLNGSPSGDSSITLQTMLYLEKRYPAHEYRQLNVGFSIRKTEQDFSEAYELLSWADLLVFCYPVYTFLVPAQLHRFVELMKEKGPDLKGKAAAQITTSKHFYDVTAHEFIRENVCDLKLNYLGGLSADMEDLLKEKGRNEADAFFKHVLFMMAHGISRRSIAPVSAAETLTEAHVPETSREKRESRRIVIVTDAAPENTRLKAMIDRFEKQSYYPCSVVNLHDFPFAGGCLGCFHCASEGRCVYKDGFETLLRDKIQTADATMYAFSIKDHSMGYRFKLFDDRQFVNGHRTVTMGKPVAYLIDGFFSKEPNLKMLIEARAQVGGNYLAGIAGNEGNTDLEIDMMAAEFSYAIRTGLSQPADFYGVGGMKIFRDLIYQMQGLMKEDHRFYKKHGFYDFPQKKKGTVLGMYLVGALMNNKTLSKKLGSNMTAGMLMPYRKVLEKTFPNTEG